MKSGADFQAFIVRREALFRNPTLEGATALMINAGVGDELTATRTAGRAARGAA